MSHPILNNEQIQHKIRRIAYQIYENNIDENEIIIAGITNSGFTLAKRIKKDLDQISEIDSTICEVRVDKKNPLEPIETSLSSEEYTNKSIVLVDDVLNSGTTLIYGVRHFWQYL